MSMSMGAARRLRDMADNAAGVIGVELLAACQGVDLRAPARTSASLEEAKSIVRARVPFYDEDRYMAPDIEEAKRLVKEGAFRRFLPPGMLPSL